MTDLLHARLPVKSLVNDSEVIEISAEISEFERLSAVIAEDLATLGEAQEAQDWHTNAVSGRLQFATGDGGELLLEGSLSADMTSVCQRSLEQFDWLLKTDVRLQLVDEGDSRTAGDDYEAWELNDGVLVPAELIDEALVMALPLSIRQEEVNVDIEASAVTEEMTTPFADLRARMDEAKN